MGQILLLLGQNSTIAIIGVVSFLWTYKYSVVLFEWIEDQTYGTREYILKKLELLQKEVKEDYITYTLLFLLKRLKKERRFTNSLNCCLEIVLF